MSEQASLFKDNPEYENFVKKFEKRLTTDDCYTPEAVYETIAEWVEDEYQINRACFIRPFWPGGDYVNYDYPANCIVVDNPPFSIRTEIEKHYLSRGIRFFLFAPALSMISANLRVCNIACGAPITYENGAVVKTSFVTNLEDCAIRTAPKLYQKILAADKACKDKKLLPKYVYPPEVVTAASVQRLTHLGVDFRVGHDESVFLNALDSQRKFKKSIFGGGFLISAQAAAQAAAAQAAAAQAAAQAAAAQAAAAQVWTLSPRERRIVDNLGK